MRQNRHDGPRGAWYIPLGYALLAGAWILFSDAALRALVPDPFLASRLQTLKGWGFVLCTALLLAVLLHREYGRLRRHQVEILHLNRLYTVLTRINHLIVREADPTVLFSDLCRVAVEDGRFLLAWIGEFDERTGRIRPTTAAGVELSALPEVAVDPVGGPVARAAAIRQTQTWHDLAGDQIRFDWRAAAREAGCRSLAAVPILIRGRLTAVFAVCAAEPRFFLGREADLVEEMAMDLGFALEGAEQRHLHLQARENLEESEGRYRSLFRNNQTPMLLVHPEDSAIVDANDAACAFYGYSADRLLGMTVPDIRAEDPTGSLELLRLAASGVALRFPARHLLAGGEVRDVDVFTGPLRLGGSDLIYVMVHDVSERKRAEEGLLLSLREKETLLKEIHHRVKNNLQLIQSLLRLQAEHFRSRKDRDLLDESLDRIHSIAAVHELLYSAADVSRVPLRVYMRKLAAYLTLRLAEHGRVHVEPPAEETVLSLDQAVPCGLLVGELLSNSLAHAFPGERRGLVRVTLATAGDRALLAVEDDGVGLPPGLDPATGGSLGLNLVRSLCEQLGGRPRWTTGPGTRFELEFPLRSPEEARLKPRSVPA